MRPFLILLLVIGAIAALVFAVWRLDSDPVKPAPTDTPAVVTPHDASGGPSTTSPIVDSGKSVPRKAAESGDRHVLDGGPGMVQFDNKLTGYVKNAQKQPIAGAEVILTTWAVGDFVFMEPPPDFTKEPKATTNAEGRFSFASVVPAQAYNLIVTHKDYARKTQQTVPVLEAGEAQEPEIILVHGAILTGVVKDEGGNKVNDATLYLESQEYPSFNFVAPDRLTAKSDAGGLYVFQNVPPDGKGRTLTVTASGYGQVTLPGLMFDKEEQQISRDVTLKIGGEISGKVVGPDNQGLPKATVLAIGVSATQQSARGSAETNDKGDFRIENLMQGEYNVICTLKGYRASPGHPNRISANTTNVILEMFKEASVSGQVLDATTGQPVPSFSVRMRYYQGAGAPTTAGAESYPQTDPDGKFTIEGVAQGDYVVEGVAPGYAPTFSSNFNVVTGKSVQGIVIKLTKGGSISGRVVDPDGKPVARARVVTKDNEWDDDEFFQVVGSSFPSNVTAAETRTGDDGRFTLKNLNPDTYQINILAAGFTKFVRKDIHVGEGAETKADDIKLQRGGKVRGTLFDAAGKPLTGGSISMRAAEGAYNVYKTKSGNEGKFELANCAPGRYVLTALRTSGGEVNPFGDLNQLRENEISIIVGEGDVTTQDLRLKD